VPDGELEELLLVQENKTRVLSDNKTDNERVFFMSFYFFKDSFYLVT